MNKISAIGRIVADAETRHTPSGDPVASFRLASDVGFGDKKTTNWFQCNMWGKRAAAIAQYLTKGTPVAVFGTLTLREWTNREGQKQISPDIRIDELELFGSKPSPEAKPANNKSRAQDSAYDDDLPF